MEAPESSSGISNNGDGDGDGDDDSEDSVLRPNGPTTSRIDAAETTTTTAVAAAAMAMTGDSRHRRRRPKTKRHSYIATKEAKAQLAREVQRLSAELEFLRVRAGLPSSAAIAELEAAGAARRELLDSIHGHHRYLASSQSLLSCQINATSAVQDPLRSFIRLSVDPARRRELLMALRPGKLRVARDVVTARTRFLDPLAPYWAEGQFRTPDGAVHSLVVEIRQLRGVASVRQALDNLLEAIATLEIGVTDVLGELTIREDGDVATAAAGGGGAVVECFNHRYASQTRVGVVQETNRVGWVEYDDDTECAVVAGDAVDVDELYPYQPATRKDAAEGLLLDAHRDGRTGELVVVLRRCSLCTMPPTEIALSEAAQETLHASLGDWDRILSDSVDARAVGRS